MKPFSYYRKLAEAVNLFSQFENQLSFDGTYFRVYGLDDYCQQRVESLSGVKKPSKADPAWRIPATPFHADNLHILKAIAWDKKAEEQYKYLKDTATTRLQLSKAVESNLDFTGFGLELHPYQKAGVEYLLNAKRVLLADEMGLGKTAQVLGYMFKEPLCFPALVICPASLKYWWKQEGERCLPGKTFTVLDSKFKPLEIQLADVVIVNYDILADGWETVDKKDVKLSKLGQALLEHPFKAIVFDEMNAVKSYKAQRTKACKKLAEGKLIRIGITGTPITNNPAELVPQLQILGRLNDLGGYMYFMKRYCSTKTNKYNPFGGSRNELELHQRMRSSFYLRRTKDDVQLELPPLTRTMVPVEITNRKEYEMAEEQFIKWVKQKAEEDTKFRESIAHLPLDTQRTLIEEYKHDKAARAKKAEAMLKIGALKRLAGKGKLKAAKEWIDNFLESGEKLVVFAMHTDILADLKAHYPDALSITSDMDAEERMECVNAFQNNGCQLLIGAMGTNVGSSPAGAGITLTAGNSMLTLELPWTSAHMDQLEARQWRMGQTQHVNSYYKIGKDTIEYRILRILDSKREVCAKVSDGIDCSSTPPLIDILMEELANC
jgi:SWI/SNF-related matrix-associated actin-dependent regulator of chromatin subfamily A-like protein 1